MANLILERKVNSGSYSVIATLPYPTESFMDSNALVHDSTYTYRARVRDDTTYSEYSSEISIRYSNILGQTNLYGTGIIVALATVHSIHQGSVNLTGGITENIIPKIVFVGESHLSATGGMSVVANVFENRNASLSVSNGGNISETARKTTQIAIVSTYELGSSVEAKKNAKSGVIELSNGATQTLAQRPTRRPTTVLHSTVGYNQLAYTRKLGRSPPKVEVGSVQTETHTKASTVKLQESSILNFENIIKKHMESLDIFNTLEVNLELKGALNVHLKVKYSMGINQDLKSSKGILLPSYNSIECSQVMKSRKIAKGNIPREEIATSVSSLGRKNSSTSSVNTLKATHYLNVRKERSQRIPYSLNLLLKLGALKLVESEIVERVETHQDILNWKRSKASPPIINSIGNDQNLDHFMYREKVVVIQSGSSLKVSSAKNTESSFRILNGHDLVVKYKLISHSHFNILEGISQQFVASKLVRDTYSTNVGVLQYSQVVRSSNPIITMSYPYGIELEYFPHKLNSLYQALKTSHVVRSIKSSSDSVSMYEGVNQYLIHIASIDSGLRHINRPTDVRILEPTKTFLIILSPLENDIVVISPIKTNVEEVKIWLKILQ